jgi:acyl-CoA reductase-like NAD-dependent aldehyde dehydrogenase
MKQQLINGQWCNAANGNTWDVVNPATEEVVAVVPYGNEADAHLAIAAAVNAFPSWSSLSAWSRAELLKKTAEIIRKNVTDFGRETTLESGKPKAEAEGEWKVAANLFEWYAEEGKRTYGRVIPSQRTDKRMSCDLSANGCDWRDHRLEFSRLQSCTCLCCCIGCGLYDSV